jgi:hypothetical protein
VLRAFAIVILSAGVLLLEAPSTVAEPVGEVTPTTSAVAASTPAPAEPATPSVSSAAYTGGGVDACIECHETHTGEIKAQGCATPICHGNTKVQYIRKDQRDFDGDGNKTEGIAQEIGKHLHHAARIHHDVG